MVSSPFNCTLLPVFVSQFLHSLPPSSLFFFLSILRRVLSFHCSKARSGNSLLYIDAKLCRSILRRAFFGDNFPFVSISLFVGTQRYTIYIYSFVLELIESRLIGQLKRIIDCTCVCVYIYLYIGLKNSWKKFVAGV